MTLLKDYAPSLVAFAVFAVLHSVGAREPFKLALARLAGAFFVEHFWRLVYCVGSYVALYWGVATLHWARHVENDVWVVVYPDWLWQMMVVLHLGSIALMYTAFLQSDYLEFLGFKQAWEGLLVWLNFRDGRARVELFGTHRLQVRGVYSWVRHPMMLGGLLFLLTSGPSLNNLAYTAMYAAYMVIGGYYEERRLVRIFGDTYRRYQAQVGAFVPRFGRRAMA